jgi:hypothetical protein
LLISKYPEINCNYGQNIKQGKPEIRPSLADDAGFSHQADLNSVISSSEGRSIYADAATTATAFVQPAEKQS